MDVFLCKIITSCYIQHFVLMKTHFKMHRIMVSILY